MANIDNECKDLEVKDFYNESTTHLADIMENQKKMQEQTYGFNFEEMSIRDIMNFWHVNTHAVVDGKKIFRHEQDELKTYGCEVGLCQYGVYYRLRSNPHLISRRKVARVDENLMEYFFNNNFEQNALF